MSDGLIRPELPAIGIVAEMSYDDRALLGDYGTFLPVQAGQRIIVAGEEQNYLYFVISGLLHVTIQVEGRDQLVARVEKGETLGEINVYDPSRASATVTAVEFSQIWKANRDDIDAFVSAYPQAGAALLEGIIAVMCRRMRAMNKKVAETVVTDILSNFWR